MGAPNRAVLPVSCAGGLGRASAPVEPPLISANGVALTSLLEGAGQPPRGNETMVLCVVLLLPEMAVASCLVQPGRTLEGELACSITVGL